MLKKERDDVLFALYNVLRDEINKKEYSTERIRDITCAISNVHSVNTSLDRIDSRESYSENIMNSLKSVTSNIELKIGDLSNFTEAAKKRFLENIEELRKLVPEIKFKD